MPTLALSSDGRSAYQLVSSAFNPSAACSAIRTAGQPGAEGPGLSGASLAPPSGIITDRSRFREYYLRVFPGGSCRMFGSADDGRMARRNTSHRCRSSNTKPTGYTVTSQNEQHWA